MSETCNWLTEERIEAIDNGEPLGDHMKECAECRTRFRFRLRVANMAALELEERIVPKAHGFDHDDDRPTWSAANRQHTYIPTKVKLTTTTTEPEHKKGRKIIRENAIVGGLGMSSKQLLPAAAYGATENASSTVTNKNALTTIWNIGKPIVSYAPAAAVIMMLGTAFLTPPRPLRLAASIAAPVSRLNIEFMHTQTKPDEALDPFVDNNHEPQKPTELQGKLAGDDTVYRPVQL